MKTTPKRALCFLSCGELQENFADFIRFLRFVGQLEAYFSRIPSSRPVWLVLDLGHE
jgi:hypothetical protein